MKKFLGKTALFFLLFTGFITFLTFKLSGNPESYNQAYKLKKRLLENTPSPRIILIGGSNVAFGFDSKMLEDSLGLPVVNNGLHAGIGLKFMLDDLSMYARAHDVLILCPEYNQFFGELAYGALPLTEVVTSIVPGKINRLSFRQDVALVSNLPGHLKSRLQYNLNTILHKTNLMNQALYSIHSFNSYGDVFRHWDLPSAPYVQLEHIDDPFNTEIALYLMKTIQDLKRKQCRVFLSPAALSETSYKNIKDNIDKVFRFCEDHNEPFINTAERYVMTDSLCFDTPYHLTLAGAKIRTRLLIRDLKNIQTLTDRG